ncbi:hypothetical protein FQA39_LY06290 [Lamprigera yunnana]|nr:hypothetical protein FQA39_LY06290 [Lamprigera yunnana]
MECLIATVDGIKFDIEIALDEQYGALPLPFPGMDKSITAVCQFYSLPSGCLKGPLCPFRHVRGDRTIVCKHWLRGLCKKGDQCEFLHEYDMTKMPECYFYSRFNACHNKECPFLHIDPESKIKDCPWYDRGFCRHGPHCRHRHVRRVLCTNYIAGCCPDGPNCKYMHPRFELPVPPDQNVKDQKKTPVIICHFCGEHGHKALHCNKMNPDSRDITNKDSFKVLNPSANENGDVGMGYHRMMPKKLEDVTCYKCGTKGHYANRCPKGHLAFLSQVKGSIDDKKDDDLI